MEKLNELDTDGVEPLIYINEDVNVFQRTMTSTLSNHKRRSIDECTV
jgi:Asp-tRNA(Asn)/Glu-tRNA(Gln) amidotransferase C subunit